MYIRIASVGLAAILISRLVTAAPGVLPALDRDVAAAVGGACQDCQVDNTGPCVGADTCVAGATKGTWTKTVKTNVTPAFCINVAAGAPGTTTCKSDTPKGCEKTQTCTAIVDGKCTNCGASTEVNKKDTNCTLGAYLCKG
jgi:hypothetical protein